MTRGWSERLYALLVALYPAEFRARFGNDMRDCFVDQVRAARERGRGAVLGLWLRTLPAALRTAACERIDTWRDHLTPSPYRDTSRRGDGPMDTLIGDLRFAGRLLRKHPAFTVVTVLIISLGTGAVTTIYSALSALVLRPLPGVAHGERVVGFELLRKDGSRQMTGSQSLIDALASRQQSLVSVAGWNRDNVTVFPGREGIATNATMVTANYFATLGVTPARGRFFLPDEDRKPGAPPVMVVSHAFWTARLGSDPDIIGRTMMVNGTSFTVVGVTPPEFLGAMPITPANLFIPLVMEPLLLPDQPRNATPWVRPIARLKNGATFEQASRELTALVRERAADGAALPQDRQWDAVRLSMLRAVPEDARGGFLGFISLMLAAATLLMLIASINVASMLSARAIARRREMAVRAALGAGRGQLVRQLLTESVLLFTLGTVGGIAIAYSATSVLERMRVPVAQDLALEVTPDLRAFVLSGAMALVAGLAFGLAPALRATSRDVNTPLREDTAGSGVRRSLAGRVLITGQLAASLVLLVSAGLFVRAIAVSGRIDTGFSADGVSTVLLNPESWGYSTARGRAFFADLRRATEEVPGVSQVSYSAVLPMSMSGNETQVAIDGRDDPSTLGRPSGVPVKVMDVDVGYFDLVKIPVVAGRAFVPSDDSSSTPVAIVSEEMSRRYWPNGGALGRAFARGDRRYTVVGIARDAKYESIDEVTPSVTYFAMAQEAPPSRYLMVRSTQAPAPLTDALYAKVRALDPSVPRPVIVTLDEANAIGILPQRIAAYSTGLFGGLGLLMAAVGLYGIISYSVSRRTREIGVRVALGASRGHVLGLVVGEGLRLTGVGVAAGLALAFVATRFLSKFLLHTNPLDGWAFGAMSLVFLTVTLVASYLPARRAAKADPMTALRTD
ncbi:MAG: ABC transporter permease [Gemmatimonadaceae bacterium]